MELELVLVSFWTEKPSGQVEHSRKEPTEHLTDCAPQLVTLHSEPTREGGGSDFKCMCIICIHMMRWILRVPYTTPAKLAKWLLWLRLVPGLSGQLCYYFLKFYDTA